MPEINKELSQQTLDNLRATRHRLYMISESELSAMSLEDQVKYGESIYQTGQAILTLETAKLKGINDEFKEKEEDLKDAVKKLETETAKFNDALQIIRAADKLLVFVSNVVKLLS